MSDMEIGPRGIPLAHGYEVFDCEEPNCGPHVVVMDKNNVAVCEIVFSPQMALDLVKIFQKILYSKATER